MDCRLPQPIKLFIIKRVSVAHIVLDKRQNKLKTHNYRYQANDDGARRGRNPDFCVMNPFHEPENQSEQKHWETDGEINGTDIEIIDKILHP